jgi:hypothetical protein
MSVAMKLATNYEKICRLGTATILLSKHISCIAIDTLLIGMELYFFIENQHVYKGFTISRKNSAMQCCVLCPFLY